MRRRQWKKSRKFRFIGGWNLLGTKFLLLHWWRLMNCPGLEDCEFVNLLSKRTQLRDPGMILLDCYSKLKRNAFHRTEWSFCVEIEFPQCTLYACFVWLFDWCRNVWSLHSIKAKFSYESDLPLFSDPTNNNVRTCPSRLNHNLSFGVDLIGAHSFRFLPPKQASGEFSISSALYSSPNTSKIAVYISIPTMILQASGEDTRWLVRNPMDVIWRVNLSPPDLLAIR